MADRQPSPLPEAEQAGAAQTEEGRFQRTAAWRLALLVTAAVAMGIGLLARAARHGVGISPDSVVYITGAESLARGHGYTITNSVGEARPITSYPPLLPAILASLDRVGLNPQRGYLAMNLVLLAATVGLAGMMIYRGAGGGARPTAAPLAGGAAALILAGSADLLQAHAFLWTEPFYLPLMFASFIATAAAADAAQNGRFARAAGLGLLAGLLAGMCYLLRYAGISIIAYQGAFLLVMALIKSGHARPKRARDGLLLAGAYTLAPMFAVGAWATRNWLVGGAGLGRRHGWHPPSPDHWDTARLVMEDWFVPGSRMAGSIQSPLKAVLILAAIAGALLVTIALAPRAPVARSTGGQSSFWRLLGPMLLGYFVVYLAFILVTITIYDYATYPDGRILLPAFMCFVIGLYSLAGRWSALDGVGRAWEVALARAVTLTFSFLLIANTVAGGVMYAELAAQRGLGYSATRWTGSQIWEDVKALPQGVVLWSNMPDAIQALQGRPARRLPDSRDRTARDRQSPHPRLREQVARLEKSLVQESALVVVFREANSARWMIITESELCEALPLVKLADRADAAIYAHEDARRIQELAQWSEGRSAPREGVDRVAEP